MKVKELVAILQKENPEAIIALQHNEEKGGFYFSNFTLWGKGHMGYQGPVIMPGEAWDAIPMDAKYGGCETGSQTAAKDK